MMAHQVPQSMKPQTPERDDQREPEERVADGGAVPALEQLAHFLPWHGRGIPCRFGQAVFNGQRGVFAYEAVVAKSNCMLGLQKHSEKSCLERYELQTLLSLNAV